MIGYAKVGRVTGFGFVVMVVYGRTGIAGSCYYTRTAVGSTEELFISADKFGVAIELCAFRSKTKPRTNPIKAKSPSSPNNRGVQQVLFSLVRGMTGGCAVFGP